jgi:hypothetical protein
MVVLYVIALGFDRADISSVDDHQRRGLENWLRSMPGPIFLPWSTDNRQ